MNKKVYKVLQGVISPMGDGDMETMYSSGSLENAKEKFEELKEDTKDWVKRYNHNTLVTELYEIELDENDEEITDIYIEPLDRHETKIN